MGTGILKANLPNITQQQVERQDWYQGLNSVRGWTPSTRYYILLLQEGSVREIATDYNTGAADYF